MLQSRYIHTWVVITLLFRMYTSHKLGHIQTQYYTRMTHITMKIERKLEDMLLQECLKFFVVHFVALTTH